MKRIIKRLLFGEPLIMSVYKDKYGNKYGGVIHKQDEKSYVNIVEHIEKPTYLGELEIY
jgi:uncharacterized protein YhaN